MKPEPIYASCDGVTAVVNAIESAFDKRFVRQVFRTGAYCDEFVAAVHLDVYDVAYVAVADVAISPDNIVFDIVGCIATKESR